MMQISFPEILKLSFSEIQVQKSLPVASSPVFSFV